MKTWNEIINPYLKKYKSQTDKVFTAYNKEVKQKKITSIAETNKLFKEKYQNKIDILEEKHNEEYKKIWNKFHKK